MAAHATSVIGSSIGAKVVMALSGVVMSGWLMLHVVGNLLVFSGAATLNGYGALLRSEPALLWAIRSGLLLAVVLHVGSAIVLARRNRQARGVRYRARRRGGSLAGRSMALSGALLLVLTAAHVLHIYGPLHPSFVEGDIHHNLIAGLQAPAVAGLHGLGVVLAGMHLHHGLWSVLRTLGLRGATGLDRWLDRGAVALVVGLVAGFLVPLVAIVAGLV